jgi:peptidoglycan/LPS O-acetylase OafA/YrhL
MANDEDPSSCRINVQGVVPTTQIPVSAPVRIHSLDNLRATAMLLGVYLHTALAYSDPAQAVWLATDIHANAAIDASVWFLHLFRMALFFLLSGYLAKWMIARKGAKYFFWNRMLRIALPFVVFYPFLLAGMTLAIVFAISYLDDPRGLMKLIADAVRSNEGPKEKQPLSTMHLWFLYYLLAFSGLAGLISRTNWLDWLQLRWRKEVWLVSPLALVPGAWLAGSPLPAPESFIPQIWPFLFYGLFFFAGWSLYLRESKLYAWTPYAWHMAIGSMLLFIPYYCWMPVLDLSAIAKPRAESWDWVSFIEAILTAYLSASLTMTSLLLAHRYWNKKSAILRFLSDASYWVYLIHLPIVVFLQTLLIPWNWPTVIKLVVVLFVTMFACITSYLVFVRYTPIGWMLHGKRSFP